MKASRELLALAEQSGARLTGKPDGSEAVTVVFTPQAWQAFDAALAERYKPPEARKCRLCGDQATHMVHRSECNSCGSVFVKDWELPTSTPIETLLQDYAAEDSDFSGRSGYEFARKLAQRQIDRGGDSQLRCVLYTLMNPPAQCGEPDCWIDPHGLASTKLGYSNCHTVATGRTNKYTVPLWTSPPFKEST